MRKLWVQLQIEEQKSSSLILKIGLEGMMVLSIWSLWFLVVPYVGPGCQGTGKGEEDCSHPQSKLLDRKSSKPFSYPVTSQNPVYFPHYSNSKDSV